MPNCHPCRVMLCRKAFVTLYTPGTAASTGAGHGARPFPLSCAGSATLTGSGGDAKPWPHSILLALLPAQVQVMGQGPSHSPVPAVLPPQVQVVEQGDAGRIAIGFADARFKLTRQPGLVEAHVPARVCICGFLVTHLPLNLLRPDPSSRGSRGLFQWLLCYPFAIEFAEARSKLTQQP
eukprot:1161809-Pelagomonas_calceolata.AAC.3